MKMEKIIYRAFLILLPMVGSGVSKGQSLDSLLQLGLERNPQVRAAHKDFEAAMQDVDQIALQDPTLSVGYFISPVETRVGPQRVRLSLSQMFPWFGTLEAQRDVSALKAQAQYQEYLDEREKLRLQIKEAFYPLYQISSSIDLQQDNLNVLQSYRELTKVKYESGTVPLSNILKVNLLEEEVNTEISILREELRYYEAVINNLLNRADTIAVEVPDTLTFEVTPSSFELSHHPQIEKILKLQESAEAEEELAAKRGMPQLGFGLDYVFVDEREDMVIEDNGKNILMPMATVSLPIWRKKYRSAGKAAAIKSEAYQLKAEAAVNNLDVAVSKAQFDISKNQELLELYKNQVVKTENIITLLLNSYSTAGTGFEELLDYQRQLIDYEVKALIAQVDIRLAIAQLEYIYFNENTIKNE